MLGLTPRWHMQPSMPALSWKAPSISNFSPTLGASRFGLNVKCDFWVADAACNRCPKHAALTSALARIYHKAGVRSARTQNGKAGEPKFYATGCGWEFLVVHLQGLSTVSLSCEKQLWMLHSLCNILYSRLKDARPSSIRNANRKLPKVWFQCAQSLVSLVSSWILLLGSEVFWRFLK